MKCLLDIDDVLADFHGAACRAHRRESPYADGQNTGAWDMAGLWGMDPEEFWGPLDGSDFWRNLEPTKDGPAILNILEQRFKQKNICLLSIPGMSPNSRLGISPHSVVGKLHWIREHLPDYMGRFLIGPCKEFCAHNRAILVDDCEANEKNFIRHGGGAILVPRPWNRHRPLENGAAEFVKGCLKKMLETSEDE